MPQVAPSQGHADAFVQSKARHVFAQPRNTTDDLVARHNRQLGLRQFAVDHVQIGAADAAGFDLDKDLARRPLRYCALAQNQRRSQPIQHHCAHG